MQNLPVGIKIQPSDLRIFKEKLYEQSGANVDEDLADRDLILGIKEVKITDLIAEKVYCYFSHTVKGQSYNMEMLQTLLDRNCTLIDYERMVNDKGQRLIYFSVQAGLAGIVETLWAFGAQLSSKGIPNPFTKLKQTYKYDSLSEIESVFKNIAVEIETNGLPKLLAPLVIGITGYGNVAKGVQQLLDLLPVKEIKPEHLEEISNADDYKHIFKVVFKEEDMVEPIKSGDLFDLQDYYHNPEKYKSKFERYLPNLTILMNASFWDAPYPRHVTNSFLKELFSENNNPKLQIIGDISCDIEGGVECTVKATDPGDPVFTFNPVSGRSIDGITKDGIVIMSVDNLPSELPKDASEYFSRILKTLIPNMVEADFTVEFDQLRLSDSIKKAIICYKGTLTPDYQYLEKYLAQ